MKIIVTYASVLSVFIRIICGPFPGEVNMRSLVLILAVFLVAGAQTGRNNATDPQDDRSDPITTLSSYYEAVNSRDFRRAYGYWESPPQSYEQFERGFADTNRVRLLIEPSPRLEGAAGSSFAEISTIVVATTRSGNERIFAGCYTLRKSNVRDLGWHIYRGEISPVPSSAGVSRMLAQGCRSSQ